ncbi:MAG TPA: 2-oxoacid:acceptor oxidoreductase subunit alpha, partial [Thermoplasmataceae archaeon]|nr:2-oxoacid:acceptor oxidoreductase subunit alpha [Thermoplasmataceae archaeon]
DVIDDLAEEGIKANLLYLKMFEPFPTNFVRDVLTKARRVVNVESNMLGQASRVIEQHTGFEIKDSILKYNGRHMTEDEILRAVKNLIGAKEHMVVLQNGA